MTYDDVKRELIDAICKNPAGFLKAQFDEGGAFETSIYTPIDLIAVPIIMCLKDDGDIHLTATVPHAAEDSYSTTEYESVAVPSESGDALAWHDDSIMCYAYEDMRGHEDYIVPASLADMLYEWFNLVSVMRGDYCDVAHAWFFPYGLYGLGEDSGMFMYATNRPNL